MSNNSSCEFNNVFESTSGPTQPLIVNTDGHK